MSIRNRIVSTLFAAVLVACTTVNVDPSAGSSGNPDDPKNLTGDSSPPPEDDGSSGAVPDKDSGGQSLGPDGGDSGTNPGGDSGMINPGGGDGGSGGDGGGVINPGGDGGLGGGGDAGAPVITANNNNWVGWNDPNQCPPWVQVPSAWKEPKTSGVGSHACSGLGFYDAYLGPSSTSSTRTNWDNANAACKVCAISDWSDPTWGPVVRTPGGHYILNQGGCYALKDPGRQYCGLSSWEFDQCGKEACDGSGTQAQYTQCVANSTNQFGGLCDKAVVGDGRSDDVIRVSGSVAYAACVATGFGDNENQTTLRVIQAFCY